MGFLATLKRVLLKYNRVLYSELCILILGTSPTEVTGRLFQVFVQGSRLSLLVVGTGLELHGFSYVDVRVCAVVCLLPDDAGCAFRPRFFGDYDFLLLA